MDFSFSEEQTMLQDSARRFLKDAYSFETYSGIVNSAAGYSPDIWRQFAELGWLGLPLREDEGGLGYGPAELLLLAEELGRGLCVEPYLANVVLAGQTLSRLASDEQRARLLPGLVDGSHQISLAWVETEGRYDPHHCATSANQEGDDWLLSGHKSMVLNAPNADHLIVIARTGGGTADPSGLGAFLVARDADGLNRQAYAVLGGGVAAVIYNTEQGALLGSLGGEATGIPSVGVSNADGAELFGRLGQSATVTVSASDYAFSDGTSMATPHVAGVAALVWSNHPGCSNEEIRAALQNSALDLGPVGRDPEYGFGLVQSAMANAYLAVNACGGGGSGKSCNPRNPNCD